MKPANDNRINSGRGWSKRSWLYFGFLIGLWAGEGAGTNLEGAWMPDDADRAQGRIETFNIETFNQGALDVVLGRMVRDAAPSSGICGDCRSDIEPERLRANPAARLCAECADILEAKTLRRRRVGVL